MPRSTLVVLLAAAALGSAVPAHAATIVVGPGANGGDVRARAGDSLVVRLPGNPATGYRWQVARKPTLLRLAATRYSPSTPGRLGSGGTYTFRFRVGKSGGGLLRLVYRRPWETAKPPLRRFEVAIRAR